MKAIVLSFVLISSVYAKDQVTLKYQPGMQRSARSVVVTIEQSFDKSRPLVPAVFAKLQAIQKLDRKSYQIPDAGFITIMVEQDGKRLESSSCHTLFEKNPKTIAGSGGATSLDGKSRKELLAKEPKDFLEFRRLWEEALALAMKDLNGAFNP